MRTGTKSLLFGVHQFAWHPLTVALAWRGLNGRWPNWREGLCILWHDWGYWGKRYMDDPDGETHPVLGARIAGALLGGEWADFCLYHSRHYAKAAGEEPSELCWADKGSMSYDPEWFYLLRARLSGELAEYRFKADEAGIVPLAASDGHWFGVMLERFRLLARERRGDVIAYHKSGLVIKKENKPVFVLPAKMSETGDRPERLN